MSYSQDVLLQEGDRVSVIGETDHGLIRGQAIVLGQTAPDWYLGRFEDGSDAEFRIDQVEEVLGCSYEMGGFLDWFRKKPTEAPKSKALIPVPQAIPKPGTVIQVGPTGVAKIVPEKTKKGFLAPLKEAVKSFFTPSEGPSIFDIFRGKRSLIPEPEKTAAAYKKAESAFAKFMPPETTIAPIVERAASLIPPEGPTPLAPYIKKAQEVFQFVKPSPELAPYEERKAKQMQLWEGMFEESKEEESLSKMFEEFPGEAAGPQITEAFPEAMVVSDQDVLIPDIVDAAHSDMAIKNLPMPPRPAYEVFPKVEDVARGLIGFYNQRGETFPHKFFNSFKEESAAWRERAMADDLVHETILETIGLHDGHPDPIEGVSIFLQIPWEEFRKRAIIEDMGDGNEEWVDVSQINEEIVYPALGLIDEAFRLIKPADVPGDFVAKYSDDCGCLQIYYVDQMREWTEMEEEYIRDHGDLPEEVTVDTTLDMIAEREEREEAAQRRASRKKKAKTKAKKAKR